jgi:hypothetical protein
MRKGVGESITVGNQIDSSDVMPLLALAGIAFASLDVRFPGVKQTLK